ncbi:MAG: NADH-quinone oxidoreductase subunit N [Bacteroidetes bacterium]|nr:MAG: NADH-quinone oxidoreductase subunit N [Bacteroidota bacterium]
MKILYILTGLGVLAMLAEIFRFKKFLFPKVLLGLLLAIAAAVWDWNTNIHYYNNMLTFDNYALLFSIVICATAFLWVLSSQDFFSNASNQTDYYALSLFALCGAVIMVSYTNLLMLFLGIEILSIPIYVLAGSRKDDLSSNESALKYFLMGAFATGFLLFGITLVYGACGTFDLGVLGTYIGSPESITSWRGPGGETLLFAGILLILIGMSFKVAAVPFHFWTPDVYQGAPTPVTAFMSTIVKTAAFAAFLRLFMSCFVGYASLWNDIIWTLAALSILLGNITAVYQSNVKRMLAYSGISHAGYMMLAILTSGDMSSGAVLYYSAAYSVASIGAFAVLAIVEQHTPSLPSPKGKEEGVQPSPFGTAGGRERSSGGGGIDSFTGLSKRNPLLAFSMTISMLSLAGIPPLAGFFGKYYLFSSALQSGYVWLVLIAVLGSLIGVYYYLKVIIKIYSPPQPSQRDGDESSKLLSFGQPKVASEALGWSITILIFLTIALSLLLGIFPDLIIRLI